MIVILIIIIIIVVLVLFSPRDLMVTSTLVEVVCCCCSSCCCRSRRRARASSLERSREKSSQRYHRFIGRRGHPWFRGPRSHASREGRPHFQLLFYVEFIYLFTLEYCCSSIVHISLSLFFVCLYHNFLLVLVHTNN